MVLVIFKLTREYVKKGVSELDQSKLTHLPELKYQKIVEKHGFIAVFLALLRTGFRDLLRTILRTRMSCYDTH